MNNEELLKNTKLFTGISPDKLNDLMKEIIEITIPANTEFIREGDLADALYILKEGAIQVFTEDRNKQEIVLARLEPGSFFGEQALLTSVPGKRNASVRTLNECTLLKVTHSSFLKVIETEEQLKKELEKIGVRQLLQKLKALKTEYDITKYFINSEESYETKLFNPGEVIIREGDPDGSVYYLLSGMVDVFKKNPEGVDEFICTTIQNNLFGESSAILDLPRQATVKARDHARTVVIPHEKFKAFYQKHPEIKKIVDTLQHVYRSPKRGKVSQYFGNFQHMPAVINKFNLQDGREVIASRVIGKNIQSIRELKIDHPSSLYFEDKTSYRELEFFEGRLVGVTVYGQWDLLPELYARVLEKGKLTEEELQNFTDEGELTLTVKKPKVDEEEIICNCMYVSRGTINACIKKGCTTVNEVSDQTGAGTICGSCIPMIQTLFGHASWHAMHITRDSEQTPDVRIYRFFPIKKQPLPSFNVGQHVVIQCEVNGNWIERSYTLTSTPKETEYYEIAIKREEKGLLSKWLFENEENVPFVRVSFPTGTFQFDLKKNKHLICFVAGIGVTPALALARSMLALEAKFPLTLFVSARKRELLPFVAELETLTGKSDSIKCNIHYTHEHGRLKKEEIAKIAQEHSDSEFFICGPKEFQNMIQSALTDAGVKKENILIEQFTHAGGPQV